MQVPLATADQLRLFPIPQDLSLVNCDVRCVSSRLCELPALTRLTLDGNPLGESDLAFMLDEWWPRGELGGLTGACNIVQCLSAWPPDAGLLLK